MTRLPIVLGFLIAAGAAPAQTIVDNVPGGRGTGPRDVAQREYDSARIKAGPLHVLPLFELWGIGWNSNVSGSEENPRGDVTANALGGLRGIVDLNQRLYLRGSGAASYAWFRRETARRHLGFQGDASMIISVPRFNFDAGVEERQSVTNISSELDRPVFERTLTAHAAADFVVVERLSIFGEAAIFQPRYDVSGLDVDQAAGIKSLERNDTFYGGGLRYRLGAGLVVGASVQETRYRFRNVTARDADGTGYVLGIGWTLPRVYVNLSGGYREFRPLVPTPTFHKTSGGFGSGRLQYELTRRTRMDLYGARRRNESALIGGAFFIETFGGLALTFGLGERGLFSITGFGEVGRNTYDQAVVSEGFVPRRDDVLRLGGTIGIPITYRFRLGFGGARTRYNSNIPNFDRTVYQVSATISYQPPEVFP